MRRGFIDAPPLMLLGITFAGPVGRYLFALKVVSVLTALATRIVATQTGHNFIAVRDNELAARVVGVPVLRTKIIAFGLSSLIIGVSGVV